MARSERSSRPPAAIPPGRQLATDQARKQLYALVKEMSSVEEGSAALLARAIEVGPRGRGGAVLIPAADAEATLRRIEELEDRIGEILG